MDNCPYNMPVEDGECRKPEVGTKYMNLTDLYYENVKYIFYLQLVLGKRFKMFWRDLSVKKLTTCHVLAYWLPKNKSKISCILNSFSV